MSRILKRPMFRLGGSSNEGVMTGLVNRKGYQEDGFVTTVGQRAAALTPELEALLRQYTPKTRLPLGEVGANLLRGQGFRESMIDTYLKYTTTDDARTRNAKWTTTEWKYWRLLIELKSYRMKAQMKMLLLVQNMH